MKMLANRIFWLLTACLSVVILAAQPLRLMTYNIRLDVASDGENDWPHRRDFLVAQLKFYAPDILGTQEGLPHQIEFLQKNLSNHASEGIGREGGGKGESTHIFFDKSKFKLLRSQTFWLSETPDTVSMGWDAACRRICTAVLLKMRGAGGQQFWVFNTHLDHLGELARLNGTRLILEKINALNPRRLPVIFMGDLNATPDAPLIAEVKTALLDTRETSVEPPFGPAGTFNGFRFDQSVSRLIDYIFVSRSPKIRIKKHAVLSDSRNLRYPSDHLPVYVEMEFLK